MNNSIIIETKNRKLSDFKEFTLVKNGRMKVERKSNTNYFKVTNLESNVMNFYWFGVEMVANKMIEK